MWSAFAALRNAKDSYAKQDLDRQIDALIKAGVDPKRIYLDKESGSTTDRPGLHKALDYARTGTSSSSTPWTGWVAHSGTR